MYTAPCGWLHPPPSVLPFLLTQNCVPVHRHYLLCAVWCNQKCQHQDQYSRWRHATTFLGQQTLYTGFQVHCQNKTKRNYAYASDWPDWVIWARFLCHLKCKEEQLDIAVCIKCNRFMYASMIVVNWLATIIVILLHIANKNITQG